jgi:hypothetical protein
LSRRRHGPPRAKTDLPHAVDNDVVGLPPLAGLYLPQGSGEPGERTCSTSGNSRRSTDTSRR